MIQWKVLLVFWKRFLFDVRVWWLNLLTIFSGYDVIPKYPGFCGMRLTENMLREKAAYFEKYPVKVEVLIASAIMDGYGTCWAVLRPGRHFHCIAYFHHYRQSNAGLETQGFLTNAYRFVDRIEARKIALANGQADPFRVNARSGTTIFSEEIWDTPKKLYYRDRP